MGFNPRLEKILQDFIRLTCEADEIGIRLSIIGGIPVWEPSPSLRHQITFRRIENSITPRDGATVIHATDVNTRLADDSHGRPDISIWTGEPEQDTEVTLQPDAVVEVICKDYEAKDLLIGVPFYRRVGIPDVLVFDPQTNIVRHWRNGGNEKSYPSPVMLDLLCGCSITV